LIDAGIERVVAAMRDPNPQVAGGGFETLKMAGIEVNLGLMEKQALWLNRGFVKRMRSQIPWVILKSAATLDGRTAAFDGDSKWITGTNARAEVQMLRASCAAVLTGIGTVLSDDPRLDVRLDDTSRQPLRVVLDSQLRLPIDARIIGDGGDLLVFTCSNDKERIAELSELGVEIVQQGAAANGRLDLVQVLQELSRWQCNEVLVEAGQALSGAFVEASLVDELVLFYAGSILGNQGRAMFEYQHPLPFSKRCQFSILDSKMVGEDVRLNAVNPLSLAALEGQS
jgi:diaminohydroxyphosphoribosylaminopyrimidine deaminase/5-amino-6-(5-phosphoribosylamino)uracil reductase